jgi:hypothetical protein
MGYTFTLTLFLTHVPTLVHLFLQIYVLFLLTVPIITMRLVAKERRLRTLVEAVCGNLLNEVFRTCWSATCASRRIATARCWTCNVML